jgi:Tfp pilus assembly protein PilE
MIKKKSSKSKKGLVFVEASIALVISIFLTLAAIDVSRYINTTNKLRVALTAALKVAQSDERLYKNIWNLSDTSTEAEDFRQARQQVISIAQNIINTQMKDSSITLLNSNHRDFYQGGVTQLTTSNISFLPPGYSAITDYTKGGVHIERAANNPYRCRPNSNNSLETVNAGGDGVFVPCTGSMVLGSSENLSTLSNIYPIVVSAAFRQNSLLLGEIVSHVPVSGYKLLNEAYVPPSPPPPPPPSNVCIPNVPKDENYSNICYDNLPGNSMLLDWLNTHLGLTGTPGAYPHGYTGSISGLINSTLFTNFGFNSNHDIVCNSQRCCAKPLAGGFFFNPSVSCNQYWNWNALGVSQCHFGCWRTQLGCFKKGTNILTNSGYKKIESLTKDDLVVNPKSGHLLKIKNTVSGPEKPKLYKFTTFSGVSVTVTSKHPMITERGIVTAAKIIPSDKLMLENNKADNIKEIKKVAIPKGEHVYNLELDVADEPLANRLVVADGIITGDLFVQQNLK